MTIPLSPSFRAGDLLFVSGQLGLGDAGLVPGGVVEETRQAIRNVAKVLAAHDAHLSDVVKTTVFLTSMADWPAMNEVYTELFAAPYPARSVVEVTLIGGALVEIEVIAHVPVKPAP